MGKQYPDAYSRDNTHYRYYGDDGEEFCLIAGQDGVTEELIASLKGMHREELASDHRYRRFRKNEDGYRPTVCSLDAISADIRDYSMIFADERADIERMLIDADEERELHRLFEEAWAALTGDQRSLFIKVYILHIPQKTIAEAEGIDHTSIRDRLRSIKKKFRKCFRASPFWPLF